MTAPYHIGRELSATDWQRMHLASLEAEAEARGRSLELLKAMQRKARQDEVTQTLYIVSDTV